MSKGGKDKTISSLSKLPAIEQRVVQGIIENVQSPHPKPTYEILEDAGYATNTARKQPGRTVGKSRIQEAVAEALENNGLSVDSMIRDTLKPGLVADKVISAIGEADGKSTDYVEVPDHAVRHKYLKTGLDLAGAFEKPVGDTDDGVGGKLTMAGFIAFMVEGKE